MKRNEAGFSMMDALLSVFIWSVCVLFFLPLYGEMRQHLIEAKRAVHVAEVMEQAARQAYTANKVEGTHEIDDVVYTYRVQLPSICVTYTAGSEANETCKTFSSDSMDLPS